MVRLEVCTEEQDQGSGGGQYDSGRRQSEAELIEKDTGEKKKSRQKAKHKDKDENKAARTIEILQI